MVPEGERFAGPTRAVEEAAELRELVEEPRLCGVGVHAERLTGASDGVESEQDLC